MKKTLILMMLFLGGVVTAFAQTQVSSQSGTINGHGYVDLGLSVKWATCNVGASSPSDYGNYYAWAETEVKSEYTEENCLTSGMIISDIAGNAKYDVATAIWGDGWRLPTEYEIVELLEKCSWEWVKLNGCSGYKVIGPNGESIFLPAAGWRSGDVLVGEGVEGCYWSAVYTDFAYGGDDAYDLSFDEDDFDWDWDNRFCGQSVRPVSE